MEGTMMALVYSGEGKLSLQEREAPKLQQPRDAIVRVTRSASEKPTPAPPATWV